MSKVAAAHQVMIGHDQFGGSDVDLVATSSGGSGHSTSKVSKLFTMFGGAKKSKPVSSSTASSPATSSPVSSPVLGPSRATTPVQSAVSLTSSSGSQHRKSPGSVSPVPSNAGSNLHGVSGSTVSLNTMTTKRLVITEKGHEHHLKSSRRQEKLGRMIRDMVGGSGKQIRNDAVSAMPDLVGNKELSLMSGLVEQIQNGEKDMGSVVRHQTPGQKSLIQKYGKCQEVIGKGAYGVVRVSHKYDSVARRDVLFAVKEFKKRTSEDDSKFSKRLTSEFCISSSLHHPNIIHTLDLMKDANGVCCQVMEYCAGGDLYSLILSSENGLEKIEADCFFKQLMRGVVYMHSMGVAHLDLKPENILLTPTGAIKVSDFGNAECFRMAWESDVHLSTGICGSKPYIAPEEFRGEEFDPRQVDVWATGIIYMAMRTGSYLWQTASSDDEFYSSYLKGRKQTSGYDPIEVPLGGGGPKDEEASKCKNVIYSILDPIPSRRITGKQVLNSEWGRSIHVCESGERGY